eukprot:TRINITY_DN2148_c0_g1_i1.p1 TRINITY_DN2148_c0_g1~~TRINITY_DN2148_c0_g1_i1.p1  ORF type:complete len:347 (-),score=69.35 TRINITY_DN2148_c0_g1_i1:99-1139(-)
MSRGLTKLALNFIEEEKNEEKIIAQIESRLKKYYSFKVSKLPPKLQPLTVQLEMDTETETFITTTPRWSVWTNSLSNALQWFVSRTDAMGWLGMGKMHVLSESQARKVFEGLLPDKRGNRLLDIGAGEGSVTKCLAPLFDKVVVTEASTSMVRRLNSYGFQAIHVLDIMADPYLSTQKFEVISCLNVLDRCSKPITLLKNMRTLLQPNGLLLLAVVFPFEPFVESSSNESGGYSSNQYQPEEFIEVCGRTWEDKVACFTENVLEKTGYRVVRISRVPYISEGDVYRQIYTLDDAIFVVTKENEGEKFAGPSSEEGSTVDRCTHNSNINPCPSPPSIENVDNDSSWL